MNAAPRRVGVFGGAFDPPHKAHRALAQAAVEQLRLDELRVLPTGQAWHKDRALTPAQHRLAMARIAFEGVPGVLIDERELHRPGATYTIDTLRELQAEQPRAAFFLVMGQDQAQAFTSWREWEAIARLATLCVAQRPQARHGDALPAQVRLLPLSLAPMDESATTIRARLAAGQDIAPLVPAGVASYIARHHLYEHP
ncbi:MAG TPA: nicotinate-nucleotide adenylyltransferase [Ramlibacter sp.]|nr:nicotinate-nucleotide adenylyltransferase [Ramlibacter sp.]